MKIGKRKLEKYQTAMFPLMLQALYNAKMALCTTCENWHLLDGGASKRETIRDINVVLDAFKSIGVKRRYGRKPVEYGEGYTLTHFNDMDVDDILSVFDPDAMERDVAIEEMKERWKYAENKLHDTIANKNKIIETLRIQRDEAMAEIKDLDHKLMAYSVYPKTAERLNGMLSHNMTATEMRSEIKAIFMHQ